MVNYRDYMLAETSRVHENIEWSTTYTFNANDTAHPRVLLIGDSICNGYQAKVREKLADSANITFWASSKCVTDPQYLRELDFLLDSYRYDFISFNNGLHSLTTDRAEWREAYALAVKFIRAKCPDAKLVLTLCTPLNDPAKDAISRELNDIIGAVAAAEALPVIDLYAAVERLDKNEHMSDVFHWRETGKELQAEAIATYILAQLDSRGGNVQMGSETGPDGAMR